jgi:hypothetical protein
VRFPPARVRGCFVATGRRDLVLHADRGVLGLAHSVEDLLVLDAQLGVVLALLADRLAEYVVLARVGRDIGQDGHLVDVRVVLGVDALEFRMDGGVAGAGQARESLIDLGVRISDTEVREIVVAGHPRRHGVGNFVGLWLELLALHETAQRFGVAEVALEGDGWTDAGAQLLLVVAARDRVHLPRSLVEDLLALVLVGEDRFITALGYEAVETGVFGEDVDFFF